MWRRRFLAVVVGVLAWVMIGAGCGQAPGRWVGGVDLGTTKAAHSLTRGHNRKMIFDAEGRRWYLFWLRDDGLPAFNPDEEGVVCQVSGDGLTWSKPVVVEPFQNGGMTAWDVILSGRSLYVLGLTDYPNASGKVSKYAIREMKIGPDGTLGVQVPQVVFDNTGGDATTVHFYGSLLQDGAGYFWVAARVGDSSVGTRAEVIRSAKAGSIDGWGPKGSSGAACNEQWRDPYAASGRKMMQGTIASRLLDLGEHGVGLITYNKDDGPAAAPAGRLLFVRNPTRAHDGWEATSLVLTEEANQFMRPGVRPGADKTRLDDRRYAAVVDPATRVIHVVYVAADTETPANANLRYFTLAPPYTRAEKSAETTLVAGEVDGVQVSLDTRTAPATLYVFYVANEHPKFQLRMMRHTGAGWSRAVDLSFEDGVVRYPQPPERIAGEEVPVAYQYSEKVPGGLVYHTRVSKVILAPVSGQSP